MSRTHIELVGAASRQPVSMQSMTAWDRAAVTLLGAAGFAFSYDALRQIALAIHARPSLSYLFPIFIDGFIAYGVRAILLLRHQPFFARLYTWFLFLAATAASLGANALHAITLNRGPRSAQSALHLTDSVVAVLSMLAPLALAGSVHLYILMARTAERAVRDGADGGPGPVRADASPSVGSAVLLEPGAVEAVPAVGVEHVPSAPSAGAPGAVDLRKNGSAGAGGSAADGPVADPSAGADGAGARQGTTDGLSADPAGGEETPGAAAAGAPVPQAPPCLAGGEEPSVPDGVEPQQDREPDDDWVEELLPTAWEAAKRAGRISRDAIQDAVRAKQAIGNDRLGILLARLKEMEEEERNQGAEDPAGASVLLW